MVDRRMSHMVKAALLVFVLVVATAFSNSLAEAQTSLRWTGCGIIRQAFMAEAAKAYEEETGGKATISLSSGGATKGIRFTSSGLSDMGGTCRPALPDKFPEEESDVYLTVVGWDALVPIINKDNPVSSITTEQLKQVLLGKITNWSELGGPDQKILFFDREGKDSGVGYMSRKILFNDDGIEYAKGAETVMSSGPLEENVEQQQWSIGITGISSARKRSLKILSVDGIEPTVENISSGKYGLFRPLFIVTKGKPENEEKKFLDWLTSDKGQEVVEKCGTVSLRQGLGLKDKFQYWMYTDRIVNFGGLS